MRLHVNRKVHVACNFSYLLKSERLSKVTACHVHYTGWAKKVIPLVQCNVMYERYHIFWPTL